MSVERKSEILKKLNQINSRLPEEIRSAEEIRSVLSEQLKTMDKNDARENVPYQTKLEEVARANSTLKRLSHRKTAWDNFSGYSNESDSVLIGSGVDLKDVTNNKEYYFVIVQKELSDAVNGALAVSTPAGKAILRKQKGDQVEVSTPSGLITYEIREVN